MLSFISTQSNILLTPRRMLRHLRDRLKKDFRRAAITKECQLLRPFLEPLAKSLVHNSTERLCRLFRAQAERTGCFIGSDFVVCTTEQLDKFRCSNAGYESGKIAEFFNRHEIAASPFRIGFVQILPTRSDKRYSMSVLAIDEGVIDRIPAKQKNTFLDSIRQIYTYGNHDYLHHFTSDTLNEQIAGPAYQDQLAERLAQSVSATADQFKSLGLVSAYEKWALKTHQWLFNEALGGQDLATSTTQFANQYRSIVEGALESLRAINQQSDRNTCTPGDFKYLASLLVFGMARVLPIDDPYMAKTIDRLSEISGQMLSPDEIDQSLRQLNSDLIDIISGRPDVRANPRTVSKPAAELFAVYLGAHGV